MTCWQLRRSPRTGRERRRGLLGRDGIEGALVFAAVSTRPHVRHALLDRRRVLRRRRVVLRICALRPWRLAPLVFRTRFVIEAEAGAFDRWSLRAGDVVEIQRVSGPQDVPGLARARRHADRQPRRSRAARGRGAARRRRDRVRGHPPHPGVAVGRRRSGREPAARGARAQRAGRRRRASSTRSPTVGGSRT